MNNRDLISREALLKKYCKEPSKGNCKNCDWYGDSWCRCEIFGVQIAEAPAVDAVEVVRCKDCLYSTERYGHMECIHGVSYRNTWNKPDLFCSYGEPKGSADHG